MQWYQPILIEIRSRYLRCVEVSSKWTNMLQWCLVGRTLVDVYHEAVVLLQTAGSETPSVAADVGQVWLRTRKLKRDIYHLLILIHEEYMTFLNIPSEKQIEYRIYCHLFSSKSNKQLSVGSSMLLSPECKIEWYNLKTPAKS